MLSHDRISKGYAPQSHFNLVKTLKFINDMSPKAGTIGRRNDNPMSVGKLDLLILIQRRHNIDRNYSSRSQRHSNAERFHHGEVDWTKMGGVSCTVDRF